ncbi:hypothetical protein POM88_000909 [Heracleum sosnowskyi]|uniref:BED-type domain-containing protein n=1 Tax=Heracleum sosnowskyi TaxID=360622 RepID=A0AAD8JBZ8_9APIA|nr:hypothetical protein POM88_000909 [Heracleum sosnowskyi]
METFFPPIDVPSPTLNTNPTPTSDPLDTNPTPNPSPEPIELKSHKKEKDNDDLLNTKKKPTRTSDVWDHFLKIKGGNPNDPRCKCKYCGMDYACHSTRVGTSSLWGHLKKCKKYPNNVADKKQKVLSFKRGIDGEGSLLVATFNKVRCWNALAKFVVKDEQAFNVVEGAGFKDFINELQPRCGAHIVNLIVNDGLTKLHDSIAAIRNSVRYIRSSPARLQKFKACVEKEKIDYKGGLILDVLTRWNSTYMMLDVALKFERAFTRYEEEDDKFTGYFMEKENGKKRIGPPTPTDWQSAAVFVKFLSTFYEVTLKFSGTLHVESVLHRLYACYNIGVDGVSTKDGTCDSASKTINKEKRQKRLLENYMQQQQLETTEKKNDVDIYLAEEPLNPMIAQFDILLWWKDNASRSSLSPKMLEALVCTQSWLKGRHDGIKSDTYLDETYSYEFLEHEEGNPGIMKECAEPSGKTINIDD